MKLTLKGHLGKTSQVLCDLKETAERLAVVFPGDLQDDRERMELSEHCALAARFCVEETLRVFSHLLGASTSVVLVRSARFMFGEAFYDHLSRPGCAAAHLMCLLDEVERSAPRKQLPLVLYGLSRGGLVLNSLASELASAACESPLVLDWEAREFGARLPAAHLGVPQKIARAKVPLSRLGPHVERLRARLLEMHYVDAGRFPTNAEVCANIDFGVVVHSSPAQLREPFVREELEAFARMVDVTRKSYFEGEQPSLETHMRCLLEHLRV